jgi:hypothetical protein
MDIEHQAATVEEGCELFTELFSLKEAMRIPSITVWISSLPCNTGRGGGPDGLE